MTGHDLRTNREPRGNTRRPARLLALLGAFAFAACEGDTGPAGPPGPPGPGAQPAAELPGVNVVITGLRGGTGPGGNFLPGDTMIVDFTVEDDDGNPIDVPNMARGAIYVSGPTFNYNRVIEPQTDVRSSSVQNPDGSWSYAFPMPIPSAYAAPYNDTTDHTENELTGQPLLDGTYTVGMELRQDIEIDGETFRDPGNATMDFLVGGATTIDTRELVTQANCNQCHVDLSVHGDNRTDVRNCLLCHTTGSEDRNVASAAGGTPGVLIEWKVMIHKIHSGANLPSVLGMATNPDGTRDYNATPVPYELVGFGDNVHDFSDVQFPVWPVLSAPMPRDAGHAALPSAARSQEDAQRSGPVSCDKCHGDPDGTGPLPAPAQGSLIWAQPTRRACGSCHDDWDPSLPYRSNLILMPPQPSDADCTMCHPVSGFALAVMDAHRHPLVDPAEVSGLNFTVTDVSETGAAANMDGTIDPGENVSVSFTLQDDMGVDVDPSTVSRIELSLVGPSENPNMVLFMEVPTAMFSAGASHTFNLPEWVWLEEVGTSSAAMLETFGTARTPHILPNTETTVRIRGANGAGSSLAAPTTVFQNFIDLPSGQGALFMDDDFIVIDEGLPSEEYMQVQWVDGDRLWFSSQRSPAFKPYLTQPHIAGAAVTEVTLTTVPTADYSIDPLTGLITEVNEFGAGDVVVTYLTEFVMPANYPGTLNESPDLDASWGDWVGLPIVDGTYRLGIWGNNQFTVTRFSENTTYREASQPANMDVLVGAATTIEVAERISSPANCYACHDDIQFHGGNRRGVETCLQCHVPGAEDRPRYLSPNGAETPGTTIDFRTMLHKIHHGKELTNAASYVVVGFGGTSHTYENVGFPAMPAGTMDCAVCHGAGNDAWKEPAERDHPTGTVPTRAWRAACITCHDSTAAAAHADVMTAPSGAESCATCHGIGKDEAVEEKHRVIR